VVALRHFGTTRLGPADAVTLLRAVLVCGVTGLVVRGSSTPGVVRVLVALTVAALALDWVDGQVARRTRTASPLGACLDMEVDAFLILVLSVQVAPRAGAWVLAIGAARYVLLLVTPVLPWLASPMPVRRWAKVVAAVQGVVLVVAASGVLRPAYAVLALGAALTSLLASFAHQVWWLHHRQARTHPIPAAPAQGSHTALQVTR
jgi:phosphatidylglycerophosphate synthase